MDELILTHPSVVTVFGTVYADCGGRLHREPRVRPAPAIQHRHSEVFDKALGARLHVNIPRSLDVVTKNITLYITNTGALSVYVDPGPVCASILISNGITCHRLFTFLGMLFVSAVRGVPPTSSMLTLVSVHHPPVFIHLHGPILGSCTMYAPRRASELPAFLLTHVPCPS